MAKLGISEGIKSSLITNSLGYRPHALISGKGTLEQFDVGQPSGNSNAITIKQLRDSSISHRSRGNPNASDYQPISGNVKLEDVSGTLCINEATGETFKCIGLDSQGIPMWKNLSSVQSQGWEYMPLLQGKSSTAVGYFFYTSNGRVEIANFGAPNTSAVRNSFWQYSLPSGEKLKDGKYKDYCYTFTDVTLQDIEDEGYPESAASPLQLFKKMIPFENCLLNLTPPASPNGGPLHMSLSMSFSTLSALGDSNYSAIRFGWPESERGAGDGFYLHYARDGQGAATFKVSFGAGYGQSVVFADKNFIDASYPNKYFFVQLGTNEDCTGFELYVNGVFIHYPAQQADTAEWLHFRHDKAANRPFIYPPGMSKRPTTSFRVSSTFGGYDEVGIGFSVKSIVVSEGQLTFADLHREFRSAVQGAGNDYGKAFSTGIHSLN